MLELTVKTLPGEHARPLQQDLNRISPDLARAASQVGVGCGGCAGGCGWLLQSASFRWGHHSLQVRLDGSVLLTLLFLFTPTCAGCEPG